MTRRGANEGTIRERKDGRWEARVLLTRPDGRRTRRSLLGRSRAEVRDKLQAALRADAAGLPPVGERLTVGAFLDLWLRDTARPKVRRRRTRATHRSSGSTFSPASVACHSRASAPSTSRHYST
jgi:hypothetical protein